MKHVSLLLTFCSAMFIHLAGQSVNSNASELKDRNQNEVIIEDIAAILKKLTRPADNEKIQKLTSIKNYFERNLKNNPKTNLEKALSNATVSGQLTPDWLSMLSERWKLIAELKEPDDKLGWVEVRHPRLRQLKFENIYYEAGPPIGAFENAYLSVRFREGSEEDVLNVRLLDPKTNQSHWIVENVLLYPQAEEEGLSFLFSMEGIYPVATRYRVEVKIGKSDEPNQNFVPDLTVSLSPQTFIYHVPLLAAENESYAPIAVEEKDKGNKEKAKQDKKTKTNHSRINQMPNEDLNAKATPSDNMACGPAAAANSLDWLNKFDANLKGKFPDNRRTMLEKLKQYMDRNDTIGVRFDSFVTGKLALIDEYKLPIHVKYQTIHKIGNDKELKSRFGNNKAENKGGAGKEPDWEWFKSEMDKGEDVELHVGYYEIIKVPVKKGSKITKDSLVRKGGHWVAATGYTDHKSGKKTIYSKDDQDQSKKGGTRNNTHELGDYNGKTEFKPRAKKIITLWESTVSESYDSTINRKNALGTKKDFMPYAAVPYPWSTIQLNDERMKPDYPFATARKTTFPWVWVGAGAAGTGVLIWAFTQESDPKRPDTTPVHQIVARCKDVKKLLGADGASTLWISDIDAGSHSTAGITQYDYSPKSFNCRDIGMHAVVLTVTDARGAQASCTANVMVADAMPPNTHCADIQRDVGPNGEYQLKESDFTGMMSDNCTSVSTSFHPQQVNCRQGVAQRITLTGVDPSGNQSTCTVSLRLTDNTAPVIQCAQSHNADLNQNGTTEVPTALLIQHSSDNCGNTTVSPAQLSFSCQDLGTKQYLLTVSDESGNTASCRVDIRVRDLTAPRLLCPTMHTATLDQSGRISLSAQDIVSSATDNCGIQSVTPVQTNYTCSDIGNQRIQFTATDISGNTSTCEVLIAVHDKNPPTLMCKPAAVNLGPTGKYMLTDSDVVAHASDNCGSVNITYSKAEFDCNDIGEKIVTVTATDGSGNAASCATSVQVIAETELKAKCKDKRLSLDSMGKAVLKLSDIDNGSGGGCKPFTLTYNKRDFSCRDTGVIPVTLTATAADGTFSSCTARVSVTDTISPHITCNDVVISLDASGRAGIAAQDALTSQWDNCKIEKFEFSKSSFGCRDIGQNSVSLTATDAFGNKATCDVEANVIDERPPVARCRNIEVTITDPRRPIKISPMQVDRGSTDNCTIASRTVEPDEFTIQHVGPNPVTLTIYDASGNSSSCTAIVTVLPGLKGGDPDKSENNGIDAIDSYTSRQMQKKKNKWLVFWGNLLRNIQINPLYCATCR